MNVSETLPITHFLQDRLGDYQGHIAPLKFNPKGSVFIIGPAQEEIGLVEPYIANHTITDVTLSMLDSETFLEPSLSMCRTTYRIPIKTVGSFGAFFDTNPKAQFQTILGIGIPESEHFVELLQELSTHLKHSGKAYLTINSFTMPPMPTIPNTTVAIIPELPDHPHFESSYFGVVLTKN